MSSNNPHIILVPIMLYNHYYELNIRKALEINGF